MNATQKEFLAKYADALQRQADADIAVRVLEMESKFLTLEQPLPDRKQNQQEQFIETWSDRLTDDDLRFLQERERPAIEVAEYRGMVTTHGTAKKAADLVTRQLRDGLFRPGPTDKQGGRRMIDTISVVEVVIGIDGETDSD